MKLLLLLLLSLPCLMSAADNRPIEARLGEAVSLDLNQHHAGDVADFLSQMLSCKVTFPKATLDSDQAFTLSVKGAELRAVFDELGKQSKTTWKAKGKAVTFTAKR